jgi:predicted nucleic acid-binding protein
VTTWLIDKSELVRLAASLQAAEWAARFGRGVVRITTVTRMETGYAAKSDPELRTAALHHVPLRLTQLRGTSPRKRRRLRELGCSLQGVHSRGLSATVTISDK